MHSNSISGQRVAIIWKKQDDSALGGTEGVILGIVGDEASEKYVVIDRSTYENSLKSAILSLGLLDLKVVPVKEIVEFARFDLRKRPPGVYENFTWYLEVGYKSNLDYNETLRKIQLRKDCKIKINQPAQTNGSSGFTIFKINSIENATIVVAPTGYVQIFCSPIKLDSCIKWLQNKVEIWQDHKRLVLIATNLKFSINDMYKGSAKPTDKLIDQLAKTNDNKPIVLPLGWVHYYFGELDKNPLQDIFPNVLNIEEIALIRDEKHKKDVKKQDNLSSSLPEDINFSEYQTNVNRYLGAESPILTSGGIIKSIEDENRLLNMWKESFPDTWQWLTGNPYDGKTLIHDLTINRKTNTYTLAFQKYSGNDFEYKKQLKNDKGP